MTLSEIAACVMVLIRIVTLTRYCSRVRRKEITPAASTWTIFTLVPSLALATYIANGGRFDRVANIGNMTDPICNGFTLGFVWFYGNRAWNPTVPQKWCFAFGAVVLVLWAITKEHFTANLLLQAIILVGYFPTYERLWKGTGREPLGLWCFMVAGAATATIPAIIAQDTLAIVYATRATCMGIIIVALILRDKRRRDKGGDR